MAPTSVIQPEVDWEAVFAGPQHGAVSTLRKDPRTNSTTTLHLAGNRGLTTRDGRPTAGQQTFFMGPGQRVVGGQLTYVYADQHKLTPKLSKVTHELLREAGETWHAKQQESITSGGALAVGDVRPGSSGASQQQHARGDAFDRAAAWSTARRAQTAPTGVTQRDHRHHTLGARPLVIYDGQSTHVMDLLPGHEGPVGLQEDQGAISLALGSDGRPATSQTQRALQMTTTRNPAGVTSRMRCNGLSRAALANQNLADTIRTYGTVFKPIDHKEYEHIVRAMEGLNSWDNTKSNLSASMVVGKPSRLMGPWEHTLTQLSLRRPTYFPPNSTLTQRTL